jgi:hypothetical protein
MKEFIEFYKDVVDTCNNSTCLFCPINKIDKPYSCQQCIPKMFDYFIKIDKVVGQKIHDEFVRLNFDKIPNLKFSMDKELYEEQLKVFERYCKNSLEIE